MYRNAYRALALLLGVSLCLIASLRWIDPPTSSVMLQRRLIARGDSAPVIHRWADLDSISPNVARAIIAAEDQRFPDHFGFDLDAIAGALTEHRARLRGASTITQQVAKNLFLWPGRSVLRKVLEAWFALQLELLWPKRRILEVYLNVAQFGPDVFGIDAASRTYFGRPPSRLSLYEASILAAVLPNPRRMHADRPSPYVLERAAWIREQARHSVPPSRGRGRGYSGLMGWRRSASAPSRMSWWAQ